MDGLVAARVRYWPDRSYEIFDDGLLISFARIDDQNPLTVTNAPINARYAKLYRGIDDLFVDQPDVHAASGAGITVKCETQYNTAATYQWLARMSGNTYFSAISGETNATYSRTLAAGDDEMQLICAVTQASGKVAYCKPITVYII